MYRFQVLEFRGMTVFAKFGGGLVGFWERRGVRLMEVVEVMVSFALSSSNEKCKGIIEIVASHVLEYLVEVQLSS